MFAKRLEIGHRAQGPPDQPLDFKRAAALLAARGLAVGTAVCGTRQHAVFGGYPAAPAVAQKMRHAILDRCRAQNMRIAEFRQAGSLGMQRYPRLECDGAKVCRGAAGGTCHGALLLYNWLFVCLAVCLACLSGVLSIRSSAAFCRIGCGLGAGALTRHSALP